MSEETLASWFLFLPFEKVVSIRPQVSSSMAFSATIRCSACYSACGALSQLPRSGPLNLATGSGTCMQFSVCSGPPLTQFADPNSTYASIGHLSSTFKDAYTNMPLQAAFCHLYRRSSVRERDHLNLRLSRNPFNLGNCTQHHRDSDTA